MSCLEYIEYLHGCKVEIILSPDITGIVKSILISNWSREGIKYEVTWIHNGDVKTGWFNHYEIRQSPVYEEIKKALAAK